jgi:hypothetical protein
MSKTNRMTTVTATAPPDRHGHAPLGMGVGHLPVTAARAEHGVQENAEHEDKNRGTDRQHHPPEIADAGGLRASWIECRLHALAAREPQGCGRDDNG